MDDIKKIHHESTSNMSPEVTVTQILKAADLNGCDQVDPVRVAELLGVQVWATELPGPVVGAVLKDRDQDPQIIVPCDASASRKQAIVAHELGYIVYQFDFGAKNYHYVDLGSQASGMPSFPAVFAARFKTALLASRFKRLWLKWRYPLGMPMLWRSKNSGSRHRLRCTN